MAKLGVNIRNGKGLGHSIGIFYGRISAKIRLNLDISTTDLVTDYEVRHSSTVY